MSHTVVFRPKAKTDLIEAHDWYQRQQFGLGETFADAVDETISRIQSMPKMYAVVFRNVRRAKVRTFPYLIYYWLLQERIEVLALLHGSRDPKRWQERVN